eukprot:TRINITY_DN2779_c2_g2_i1.p1 TRINITY_DN2779_c2_g2~~TRINITY_DN2779_c2_g2_i1.p1  ORF type:complete len:375 (+),score=63.14 TRINITY_DN2779_c2_g2_i1:104-1228(+)
MASFSSGVLYTTCEAERRRIDERLGENDKNRDWTGEVTSKRNHNRPKRMDRAAEKEKQEALKFEMDKRTILVKRPESRLKWLQRALVHTSKGHLKVNSIYELMVDVRFVSGIGGSIGKQIWNLLVANLHLFSQKQQRNLQAESGHFRAYAVSTVLPSVEKDRVATSPSHNTVIRARSKRKVARTDISSSRSCKRDRSESSHTRICSRRKSGSHKRALRSGSRCSRVNSPRRKRSNSSNNSSSSSSSGRKFKRSGRSNTNSKVRCNRKSRHGKGVCRRNQRGSNSRSSSSSSRSTSNGSGSSSSSSSSSSTCCTNNDTTRKHSIGRQGGERLALAEKDDGASSSSQVPGGETASDESSFQRYLARERIHGNESGS